MKHRKSVARRNRKWRWPTGNSKAWTWPVKAIRQNASADEYYFELNEYKCPID